MSKVDKEDEAAALIGSGTDICNADKDSEACRCSLCQRRFEQQGIQVIPNKCTKK